MIAKSIAGRPAQVAYVHREAVLLIYFTYTLS